MFENQNQPDSSRPLVNPLKPITAAKPAPVLPPTNQPTVPQPPKEPIKKTGSISSAGIAAMILFLLLVGSAGGYVVYRQFFAKTRLAADANQNVNQNAGRDLSQTPADDNLIQRISGLIGAPIALAGEFARYDEPAVNVSPALPAYQAAADLSNLVNQADFTFSPEAKNLLAQNNFVVTPAAGSEFFTIYEDNRYRFVPNFITSDSLVHNYHLAFDFLLRSLEINKLKRELTDLTYGLVKASQAQFEQLKGTAWENAAKRNVAFFTVANKLVYPAARPADYVAKEVNDELALIEARAGIETSPVMNLGLETSAAPLPEATPPNLEANKEDYSQYIPRGHYTRSADLKVYFKSMMYLGRLTFRLKSVDETKSAILITHALQALPEWQAAWEKIYEPTGFFVGQADDLSYVDYGKLVGQVYGQTYSLSDLTEETKFNDFLAAAKNLPAPKVNSLPIFDSRFQPDREKEIKGFRFMGQRYTLDADIFQRLVYREAGDKEHVCQTDPLTWSPLASRRLPSALDVAAAFGSTPAADIQDKKGETNYACYTENLNKMRSYVAGLDGKIWTQNLYWSWLYFLRPLLAEKPAGYPSFMTNEAWLKKELNTFLASWTELKRDTVLYAKQVYAELGGGGSGPEPKDDRGYVEPNPYIYARLAALVKTTKEGLQLRNLISQTQIDLLDRLNVLALRLKEISEKELNNQPLSDDDYEFIRSYGGSLEHIWLEANKDIGIESTSQLSDEPAAIVTDVASDPNGQVLEEGTGRIFEIYVVVPIGGKLRLARGGVFSHYEFTWPLSDRLTDEKWRTMLDENKQPALDDWTGEFIAK